MKVIDIHFAEKTPRVILDDEKKVFEISGSSYPNNIRDFSLPVINQLKEYLEDLSPETPFKFNFKMAYFNSATAKFIADIFLLANDFINKQYNIELFWFYQEGDDDMFEAGRDFAQLLDVQLNYVMIAQQTV